MLPFICCSSYVHLFDVSLVVGTGATDCLTIFICIKTRSGTDPILLLILLFSLGQWSSKKSKAPLFQIGSGLNLAGLFFNVNMHRLTESDFGYDVPLSSIIYDVISCRKVLSSGECTCSVHLVPASNFVHSS